MAYSIDIAKKAKKFIKALPKHEALKIVEVIDDLARDPRPRWVEKLKGIKKGDYYRISRGNYRILYSIHDDVLLICVIKIDGRDDSYKKLNKKLK